VTIDAVYNAIASQTKDVKAGKFSSILKKTRQKAEEVAVDQFNKAVDDLGEGVATEEINNFGARDNTNVTVQVPSELQDDD
jgi:hypothetical protein